MSYAWQQKERPWVHYKLLVFLFLGLFFFHSPLNHLLYEFFLLRSTIITTTIAAIERIANNVSLKEKEDRLHELNELINKYSKESNLKMLNKSVKVLITGVSEKDDTKVCGYTENMKLVNVDAPKEDIGKIINVKITEAKSFSLDGIKES